MAFGTPAATQKTGFRAGEFERTLLLVGRLPERRLQKFLSRYGCGDMALQEKSRAITERTSMIFSQILSDPALSEFHPACVEAACRAIKSCQNAETKSELSSLAICSLFPSLVNEKGRLTKGGWDLLPKLSMAIGRGKLDSAFDLIARAHGAGKTEAILSENHPELTIVKIDGCKRLLGAIGQAILIEAKRTGNSAMAHYSAI